MPPSWWRGQGTAAETHDIVTELQRMTAVAVPASCACWECFFTSLFYMCHPQGVGQLWSQMAVIALQEAGHRGVRCYSIGEVPNSPQHGRGAFKYSILADLHFHQQLASERNWHYWWHTTAFADGGTDPMHCAQQLYIEQLSAASEQGCCCLLFCSLFTCVLAATGEDSSGVIKFVRDSPLDTYAFSLNFR